MNISKSFNRACAEFLGVMIFVVSIFALNYNPTIHNFVFAGTLAVMIMIFSPISGAHLNPAVSLFFYIRNQINFARLVQYWIAQLLGSVAGIYLGYALSGKAIEAVAAPANYSNSGAFIGEVFSTLMLIVIITILLKTKRDSLIPYAVGLWVLAASSYTITGAQANPAVTLARVIRDGATAEHLWTFAAEIVGVLLALVYVFVFDGKEKKK
jgi:glycerol uptake facilitator-like aquaporin